MDFIIPSGNWLDGSSGKGKTSGHIPLFILERQTNNRPGLKRVYNYFESSKHQKAEGILYVWERVGTFSVLSIRDPESGCTHIRDII